MKKELIRDLFQKFESIYYIYNDVECWSARELQKLLGYSKCENFEKEISKAKDSGKHVIEEVKDRFPDFKKTIPIHKGSKTKDIYNNLAVLKMLIEHGIVHENLPLVKFILKL
ncbi:MAG: hypothetical protein KG003_01055 [Bacteroidetes bacterium]|nr:hypothetical protein [Bacteroidota bacterium]